MIPILLILTLPVQALQIHELANNGFYEEDIARTQIINHYHTTYIPFNITNIGNILSQLLTNIIIIKPLVDEHTNNTIETLYLHTCKLLNKTFDTYDKLKLHKENRTKRGLFNFLGAGIKFVTGNLDDNDLQIITQNFEVLKRNQLNSMHKINELSSIAGHVMSKFRDTLKSINDNSDMIQKQILQINNQLMLTLSIQDLYIQIHHINDLLEKLIRVLSFAHLETLDLEILSPLEISEIWQYLLYHYPKKVLWSISHMTELTLICKTGALILNDMVILAIKIPVFEQSFCDLKFVYPIPNNQSKILISPSKFYCGELWFKKCEEINAKWICAEPLENSCILRKNCYYANIANNYKVHSLTYHKALLICTKSSEVIYENCFKFEEKHLKGCNIVGSQCDVIFNQYRYALASNNITVTLIESLNFEITNYTLNFKVKHLNDPGLIEEDLLEPIKFEDFAQSQSNIITTSIFIIVFILIICTIGIVIYQWKKQKYLKYIPIKTLQKLLNEDVEKSKGGGEMSLNPRTRLE